jgi:hypothetical protein
VQQDPTGHIEEQEPVNAGCDLTLCRGMVCRFRSPCEIPLIFFLPSQLFSDQPASNVLTVNRAPLALLCGV